MELLSSIFLLKNVNQDQLGGGDELARDMWAGLRLFSIAIGAEFTGDSHSHLPPFIPGTAAGKLKMSFNVGEHGAATTGGFNSAPPMPATFLYGGLLEAVTHVLVRKAEEKTGDSGDGIGV